MIDFELTEEQQMIRDTVVRSPAKRFAPPLVPPTRAEISPPA